MANTWGESGTTWGQGNWSRIPKPLPLSLTGLSITATDPASYP